jgi:hypothetical protein
MQARPNSSRAVGRRLPGLCAPSQEVDDEVDLVVGVALEDLVERGVHAVVEPEDVALLIGYAAHMHGTPVAVDPVADDPSAGRFASSGVGHSRVERNETGATTWRRP